MDYCTATAVLQPCLKRLILYFMSNQHYDAWRKRIKESFYNILRTSQTRYPRKLCKYSRTCWVFVCVTSPTDVHSHHPCLSTRTGEKQTTCLSGRVPENTLIMNINDLSVWSAIIAYISFLPIWTCKLLVQEVI